MEVGNILNLFLIAVTDKSRMIALFVQLMVQLGNYLYFIICMQ